jgi:superfamily I DNA and RNA helicase
MKNGTVYLRVSTLNALGGREVTMVYVLGVREMHIHGMCTGC